jgi:hypothetical protein
MAFLTDAYIESMLGGGTRGPAQYAAIATDSGARAAYIASADAVVLSACAKGGYSSVTLSPQVPSSGPAFELLRLMSFGVWLKLASFYARGVTIPAEIVATIPDPSSIYATDGVRLDLPGLSRDPLGGDGGADLINGTEMVSSERIFSTRSLILF